MQIFRNLIANKQVLRVWQSGLTALGGTAIALGVVVTTSESASAQAAYGSYIGAGISGGLTEGEELLNEDRKISAVVAARYKFLRAPISIRTQALIGDSVALVPTISYDLPLTWRADAYVGIGASIPLSGDRTTPVGNQTAFAIQPGIDYVLPNSNLVVFGNAIIAFDAYREGGGPAASLQGGVGLRF